jgi:hypothetical protein
MNSLFWDEFFVIEGLEEVNMATLTWPWEQIQYTSSYGLFKTVINEEKRDMRMKCKTSTNDPVSVELLGYRTNLSMN